MTKIPTSVIYWQACDCYIWPLVAIWGINRCGFCGVRPHTEMPPQEKARPLTDEEKWNLPESR